MFTITFAIGAAGNMALTFYPAIWWLTAAFRPDRSAELIYLMSDMSWLQFIGGVTIYLAMPYTITAISMLDKSPKPLFPRWAGYANALLGTLVLPDQLLFFFHRGPFAWNGIIGLWLPASLFGGFFIFNFFVVRRAILQLRSELQ